MSRLPTFTKSQRLHLFKCLKNYQELEITRAIHHLDFIMSLPRYEVNSDNKLKNYHKRLQNQRKQLSNYVNIILNDLNVIDGHKICLGKQLK